MELTTYLEILRRRWLLPVAGALVALVAVWVLLPARAELSAPTVSYQATSTLIALPSNDTTLGLPTIALFATVGEVPRRAAERLRYDQDPQVLASMVTTAVDSTTGTLTITSNDTDGPMAAQRANVFAEELVSYFRERSGNQAKARLEVVNRSIARTATEIDQLDEKLALDPDNTLLAAERSGVRTHYEDLVAQASSLQGDLGGTAPAEILQPAVPVPTSTGVVAPPAEPWKRLLVGTVLGLAMGFALALVVERVDSRLRSREQVEEAFELPVLAEIPSRPLLQRHEVAIASAVDPGGATAEAYRALRSSLVLLRPAGTRGDGSGSTKQGQPTVVLVTSCRPAEGKTSTVANLAVVLAETGRRVLVLSLDFRNPRVHEYLDAPSGAGLSDLLSAGRPEDLEGVVRDTAYPGVQLATSGQETRHPGALLTAAGDVVAVARELADVVLIDTAPMLAVSDAVDLSPHVDAVVVVSRVNRTTTGQARASHRLLSRLEVPALGVVLVGVADGRTYHRYPGNISLVHQLAGRLGVRMQDRRDERTGASAESVSAAQPGRDDG